MESERNTTFGLVGLGKMGASMARRLLRDGHRLAVTDLAQEPVLELGREGAVASGDLDSLVRALAQPRVVWMMVPAGDATEGTFRQLSERLAPGDVIVDGANSDWRDSRRRADEAAERDLVFVDVGVSGGVWGLEHGYNLMVGGEPEGVERLTPVLRSLAGSDERFAHVGPAGAGHFVKMIHNGVEYALMQSYAEGLEAMRAFPHADIDLERVVKLWQSGSVVRSWLLELTARALERDPQLEGLRGYVQDSGMGRWTVEYAVDHAVPMPAVTAALFARFASRQEDSFAAKVAAALRNEFGGHSVKEVD